jgi:hypothetical protein
MTGMTIGPTARSAAVSVETIRFNQRSGPDTQEVAR